MIIYGSRLFGLCHLVPGHFYVATKFGHIFYIPLIPLGSWIIVAGSETDNGFRGTPIGIHGRSMLLGYLRGWLAAAYLVLCGFMALQVFEHGPVSPVNVGLAVVASLLLLVLWRLTYRFSVASTESARELAVKFGYPQEHTELIEMPEGVRALGPPKWGFALSLLPMLAWVIGGFATHNILMTDRYTFMLDALQGKYSWSAETKAGRMIDELGPADEAGVPVFVQGLQNSNETVQLRSAQALRLIRLKTSEVVDALLKTIDGSATVPVRIAAAETLTQLGSTADVLLPRLLKLLTDSDTPADQFNFDKRSALRLLGSLGPEAAPAIPDIEVWTNNADEEVRKAAAQALQNIRGEAAEEPKPAQEASARIELVRAFAAA